MTENSTRAISGLLYVGLILGSLFSGELYFSGVIFIFSLLVLWEYCRLSGFAPYAALLLFSALFGGKQLGWFPKTIIDLWIIAALVSALLLSVGLFKPRKIPKAVLAVLAVSYIMGGSLGIMDLYGFPQDPTFLVVLTYGSIWMNNTFAYLFGKSFGKRLLAPNISPKKSWEGFWGGAIFAVLFSILYGWFLVHMPWTQGLVFGFLVAIFATLGDLVQSQMKRQAQVKDSGSLLPGHGGFFDRMDSIIFTAPVIAGVHIIFFYVS